MCFGYGILLCLLVKVSDLYRVMCVGVAGVVVWRCCMCVRVCRGEIIMGSLFFMFLFFRTFAFGNVIRI